MDKIIRINTSGLRIPNNVKEFFEDNEELFKKHENLWVKGGGAREVLVGYIRGKIGGFEADIGNVRDIDLILIGGGYLEKIPRGVDFERKGSIEEYFNTRDFHINKVLLRPKEMIFSEKAVRDGIKEKISPIGDRETNKGKLALRGILFSIKNGWDIDKRYYEDLDWFGASDFEILLMLTKAYEYGIEDEYFREINKGIGRLGNYKNVHEAFEELLYNVDQVRKFIVSPEIRKRVERGKIEGENWDYYDDYEYKGINKGAEEYKGTMDIIRLANIFYGMIKRGEKNVGKYIEQIFGYDVYPPGLRLIRREDEKEAWGPVEIWETKEGEEPKVIIKKEGPEDVDGSNIKIMMNGERIELKEFKEKYRRAVMGEKEEDKKGDYGNIIFSWNGHLYNIEQEKDKEELIIRLAQQEEKIKLEIFFEDNIEDEFLNIGEVEIIDSTVYDFRLTSEESIYDHYDPDYSGTSEYKKDFKRDKKIEDLINFKAGSEETEEEATKVIIENIYRYARDLMNK